jgi:hypothetical protein
MRLHLDTPIDSDLSYESFKARYRPGQPLSAHFDSTRCSLKVVSGYSPRLFVADPDLGDDLGDTDEHVMDLTLWHYRAPQRK